MPTPILIITPANAPLAMTNDNLLPFSFPATRGKKVAAAFDGGRLTSDGGVMLLAMAERRLGVADRLARCFPDRRDPTRVLHSRADMIRARIHAIACGYEDADDLDFLRTDPAFKLACGRLPETGGDLCSQPTLSRMENAPSLKDAIRLTYALVDQWMASYERAPASVILDIDDTCDVAHGHQQLSLFNAHYDERCFLPIHVYDTERSRPVAVVLRPGKTVLSDKKAAARPAVVASVHEQPVPIFQQLAGGHPSCRDDVREIPAVAAQRRGSPGRARDRHQPRDRPVLVEPVWPDVRRRDPQEADRAHARLSSVALMEWMPPPDGIAMCQGGDVCRIPRNGEGIHEGS